MLHRATQAALLAALPLVCHAEPQTDEVVVTATRETTSTVSATELDATSLQPLVPATSDSAALLRDTPGLSLYGAGGVSSLPAIHGLADDRLRTKIDGMDLISACANHMNSPLSYIDPSNVGKVTVFSGVSPVSVGGDSIGGSILVESRAPQFAEAGQGNLRQGSAGMFYRSNGDGIGGNLSATLASDKASLSYQGAIAKADDYRAGDDFKAAGPAAAGRGWLDGDEVGSSMYKAINHNLNLGLRQDNHLFELKVGVQDIPYQGWPNQRMDMTANDSTQVNLNYTGEFNWGQLEARAYNEHTRHSMQFYDDKLYWYGKGAANVSTFDGIPCTNYLTTNLSCASGMPMDTEGDNTGFSIQASIDLNPRDLLRVGAELQNYDLDDWWDPAGKGMWPNTFWNIRGGERDRLALFAEWEAKWTPQWQTQLGLRGEQVEMDTGTVQGYNATYNADANAFNAADRSRTDDNLDLTALAHYTPDDGRDIEFGYARKTRSPNLYERYAWSTGGMAMNMVNWAGDGNGYVGNLTLDPEVAHTLSLTADWHDPSKKQWGLKITPYLTYVDDYIDAQRCWTGAGVCSGTNATRTNSFVFLQFVNQSARLYGLDISGFLPLTESASLGSLSLSGLLGYTQGENETTGDNLYNIMPLHAKLALQQKLGPWANSLELELVDDKDDVSWVRNEVETDSYALVHLRGSYQWKQARFDFGVENLFDTYYEHPLGGAYVGEGKTMPPMEGPVADLATWGTPVPGMGRSLYAGVKIDF